ncbi:hypothetical protein IAR55_002117 [Kwoniella newhampshirensis]|uniref:Uncharacterized protein n=1 Tax=Kwoniella newhampshirensis TaxID=1651941 RepID=A0AAW0Z0T6_9TREE
MTSSTAGYEPLPSDHASSPSSSSGFTYPPTAPFGSPHPRSLLSSFPPLERLSAFLPYLDRLVSSSHPQPLPLPGPGLGLGPNGSSFKPSHRNRLTPPLILRYLLYAIGGLVISHYALVGAFPSSSYSTRFSASATTPTTTSSVSRLDDLISLKDEGSTSQAGTFFRDPYPIKSMLAFWELAEKEVLSKGHKLDTCHGQLGRELVEAYHEGQLSYCRSPSGSNERGDFIPVHNKGDLPPHSDSSDEIIVNDNRTEITCIPVHHSKFSKWWPYPASPCLSKNLRPVKDQLKRFQAVGCEITREGDELRNEMGREKFLGGDIDLIDLGEEGQGEEGQQEGECKERIERTVVVIGRQDQWNPFHVAEDLITTLVTIFIAARTAPALINTRVQLVFAEGFGMDQNHFTPLWDRIGAWAPRRLSLDPWGEGVCLTNAIHSVGAGASLLSAMGVGQPYSCVSTITWAASHYYRHIFGLIPRSLSRPASNTETPRPRRPINVLWLSRAKLDSYAKTHNDWSSWRDIRHISNEPELVAKFRTELAAMCEDVSSSSKGFGPGGCVFEDAQEIPETWALSTPSSISSPSSDFGGQTAAVEGEEEEGVQRTPVPIRFATLDPTVHALETQIHFVGHTTILISSHGGALGLSLFLPPGDGVVIELQVEKVQGNFHFQHMAKEMGHEYEMVEITRKVDTDVVWQSLRRWIWKVAQTDLEEQ